MTIGADGHGDIAFGAMQAGLDLDYSRNMVFFTWAGFEEGDEFTGSGSAEINDDGTIEIEFAYHLGDEALLKAEPVSSSTACYATVDETTVNGDADYVASGTPPTASMRSR
jgi:hypothetical protein